MHFTRFSVAALVTALSATAAFAVPLESAPTETPFAISLGITFAADAPAMALETIAASVATGGTTVVTNATAASNAEFSATSSTGGASAGYFPLNSAVQANGDSFSSQVGTGYNFYPE